MIFLLGIKVICVREMLTRSYTSLRKPQQKRPIQSFLLSLMVLLYCITGQKAVAAELQYML